jgi:choline dehydrogenase
MSGLRETYDYVIVGAGSAGCVLANRLTRDGRHSVLLIEAGPEDSSPLIRMPKGFGKLLGDPKHVWRFNADPPPGGANTPALWHRGKTLGGSSSVNGMVYTRGDPSDYDAWEALGLAGWNWASMARAFKAIENHELGEAETRGAGGPLHVSSMQEPNATGDAFIASAQAMGLPLKADLNEPSDQEGVGYAMRTIRNGARFSAAEAFLKPARRRSNLRVVTDSHVDRLIFEGDRVTGVACMGSGGPFEARCGREVILAAGALNSPRILQLSGVGPAAVLAAAGVQPRLDRAAVGRHMREHRVLFMQYRLNAPHLSQNREFSGLRLVGNVLKYAALRRGVMAQAAYEVGAFLRSRPGLDRPDVQLLMGPFSLSLGDAAASGPAPESLPGLQCITLPLRPTSEGEVLISAAHADAPLTIRPNFLSTEEDRISAIAGVRFVRRMAAARPLADLIVEETVPGREVQSDEDILTAYRLFGSPGYHAVGTCRMGAGDDAVTDPRLRVRGLNGLRIVDCSVMPTIPSGNTNGPVMALAWRAADLILEDAA